MVNEIIVAEICLGKSDAISIQILSSGMKIMIPNKTAIISIYRVYIRYAPFL